ncbi:hypothetical protein STRIP9103_04312 [Streptomyces ipomoeae 91-03]|uniref:Uncharacterized protein n=1 Tax=Streptomyces ipomoeae 91-03 TaxID=698759 RepID=L1KNV5_9ACTN|nr:hypothetical protein STRIP9103_04312 [Streptomyces ipomoeae 91-03]
MRAIRITAVDPFPCFLTASWISGKECTTVRKSIIWQNAAGTRSGNGGTSRGDRTP